jgi:hypothetical protein
VASGEDWLTTCLSSVFVAAFPGGVAKEDIGDLIQRMEELAIIQVPFGRMAKA